MHQEQEFVPLDSLIIFAVSAVFFFLEIICVCSQPPPQTTLCPHFTESPPTWSRLPRPTYQEHLRRDLPGHVEVNHCNRFDKSVLPHSDARAQGDSRHGPLTL